MTDYAIQTDGLSKSFGARAAVSNLTITVPRGEVFAFLGPNGAGKSTSVKMLLGLVAPSGGSASVLGLPPGDPRGLARVGFLPEHFRFHPWLQAAELLDLHGRLYSIPAPARAQRVRETLDLVGLGEHARRPIAGFSKGMLQRIGLAQALLNRPDLVFLDEPTSALDPFGRILVREIIHQLKREGTTVFLNSHLLGEVEATADRAAFIREGVVLRSMALGSLAEARIELQIVLGALPEGLAAALRGLCGGEVRVEQPEAGRVTLTLALDHDEQLPVAAELVQRHGAPLFAFTPRRASLEQIFLEVIGRQDSGQ